MPSLLDENLLVELVEQGVAADTFRRLKPEKRERVYRTALRLFGDYGIDGWSIDRLCDEAGISKGSFFQYFPSKTHLLELVVLVFDNYLARAVEEIKFNESAVLAKDRLTYLYDTLVVNTRLHVDEQKFYLFVTSGVLHTGVVLEGIDLSRHFREYIADIIERGIVTGEIRSDFAPALTARLVSALIGGLVERRYTGSTAQRRQVGEYLVTFLFDGIKA